VGDDYGTTHPLDCCCYVTQGQPVELQQYIGIEDVNKTRIFEGDVLAWDETYLGFGVIFSGGFGVVKQEEVGFFIEEDAPVLERYDIRQFNVRVVGEVHTYENGKYL
jgi:uncharacterized phage protein (TIGR01671 family)